ncbi:hypothetical protein GUJ93_ZPchr0006g45192 [Zizania palustris]|uniref:Uncharacterized protein n=1 Tax=Zizania palustris TaxID=103762 RepID=A0A8J5T7G5_ZIZPA|nr:hypothetical protein GUJ93_ZPchr0006g45192 [Zizania palustris]
MPLCSYYSATGREDADNEARPRPSIIRSVCRSPDDWLGCLQLAPALAFDQELNRGPSRPGEDWAVPVDAARSTFYLETEPIVPFMSNQID